MPVGPAVGKGRLTKAEAARKGAEIVDKAGVNTQAHLTRAEHPESVETLKQRVAWCQRFHRAWTESKPGSLTSMESHLTKHILPRFGELLVEQVTEKAVQEWVADLRRQTFEMKKPNGSVIKTYKLSRKSILNIVGVLKLVLGRKVWMSWEELNLGKPPRSKQRYFTEEQLKRIIEAAPDQYRVLFAVLAGTGMRIGEAAGCMSRMSTSTARWFTSAGAFGRDRTLPRRRRMQSGRLTSMRRSPRCFDSSLVSGKPVGCSKAARGRRSPTATSASACSIRYSNGWGFPKLGCTRSGIHA